MLSLLYLKSTFSDLKHIMSQERLPFSLTYFGSLGLTLYFAIGVSDYCKRIAEEIDSLRLYASNDLSL